MRRLSVKSKLFLVMVAGLSALLQSCGGEATGGGDLIGVAGREAWGQSVPFGMVVCPSGTFHMGQADENIANTNANRNRQITIGGFYMDDTEITNNEYRQFINAVMQDSLEGGYQTPENGEFYASRENFLATLYPDTTVWMKDFTHHMGDPMMEYYYMHPAFDDYPVVGVRWTATKQFCAWRTDYMNEFRVQTGQFENPRFRLPSEAEWEYASRGGRDMAKYPWGNPYIRNAKGCMLANFKPGRGNYYDDGFMYTSPIASYFSNDFGLYDMAGNVAEWCEDAYNPAAVPVVWDLNPTYYDENEPRKVIRGGSWKDIAFYLESGTRTFEYEDTAKSFIGFRCVMTYLGRSSGSEF